MPKFDAVTALDLGNNGTRAARISAHDSAVLKASNGRDYILTAIARRGSEWIVGEDAERLVREDSTSGIVGLKRLLKEGVGKVEIAGQSYQVLDLIGTFIKEAFPDLPELTREAPLVVSYPTGSSQAIRESTVAAIQSSGCKLLKLDGGTKALTIDEATALAMDAVQEAGLKPKPDEVIYVTDHGHITGDHTLLVAKKGHHAQIELVPVAWSGSPNLGGLAVDQAIVDFIGKTRRMPKHTPHTALMAARVAKNLFGDPNRTKAVFRLAGFGATRGPVSWEFSINRDDLQAILVPFRQRIQELASGLLSSAKTSIVNHVIIGGGLANLPELPKMIAEATRCESVKVIASPELATVKGAGLYGAMYCKIRPGGVMVNPVIRRDVIFMVNDTEWFTALKEGSSVPTEPFNFEVNDPRIKRLRVAEAGDPGAINLNRTPTFFELPKDHRFVQVRADLTGIQVSTKKNPKDSWTMLDDVDWSARPEVDRFLVQLTQVCDNLAGVANG